LILINGFNTGAILQGTCTLAADSTGTFGQLEALATTDGASVQFFDNCVYGTPRIEVLGEELGKFIAALKHTDGSSVEKVDIVAYSMGALIARSYLAGKKLRRGRSIPPLIRKFENSFSWLRSTLARRSRIW
jgi:triacylglycerol esterase/lipase EstA (alpha/beta hydrolase family)